MADSNSSGSHRSFFRPGPIETRSRPKRRSPSSSPLGYLSTPSYTRRRAIQKLTANPAESKAYARKAAKNAILEEKRIERYEKKAYEKAQKEAERIKRKEEKAYERAMREDKKLYERLKKEEAKVAERATRRSAREAKAALRETAKAARHQERVAARASRQSTRKSPGSSAEWSRVYAILKEAVNGTDRLSEGTAGNAAEEAKVYLEHLFTRYDRTSLGDKLRKFVKSKTFVGDPGQRFVAMSTFGTRGEYKDLIKAAVLEQVKPSVRNPDESLSMADENLLQAYFHQSESRSHSVSGSNADQLLRHRNRAPTLARNAASAARRRAARLGLPA
jgi:hypothetical protein